VLPALFPTEKNDPELAPFRAALVFGFFNALTWQIGIGTPMVLFAQHLGATSFQVGLAYSFVFLLTPIQVLATALLPRFGFKRVSLGGWGARSVFLAVPVWLAMLAPETGRPWMVNTLIWSVFLFCLFRSIGAAAMTSWFYGFLPPGVRGRYFASDQMLSGIAGVGTLVACAALFALLPIYTALLVQYVIALVGSTLSYYSLKRLPDIEKPDKISLRSVLRDTPRHMFAPSEFRSYLWCAVMFAVITTSIPPFAAYYLAVAGQRSPGEIMLFEVLRYSGVILGAFLIRRQVDAHGARPFFRIGLGLYAVVAVAWWIYLERDMNTLPALFAVYFIVGLAAVCWNVANLNYLPKLVPAGERALFVSIHGAVTSCLGGSAPILWGLVMKTTGPDGAPGIDAGVFQAYFLFLLAGVVVLMVWVRRLREDVSHRVEPALLGREWLRPFRAASSLVNLIDPRTLRRRPPGDRPDKKG
jgi:MFS family permease